MRDIAVYDNLFVSIDKKYKNLLNEILEYRNKYGDEKTIRQYEDKVFEIGDLGLLFEFCKVKGVNLERLTDFVIDFGDADIMYDVACIIKGVDISRLIYECCAIDHGFYYDALKDFPDKIDYNAIAKQAVKKADFSFFRDFILNVNFKKINVQEISKLVLKSGKISLINAFVLRCKKEKISSIKKFVYDAVNEMVDEFFNYELDYYNIDNIDKLYSWALVYNVDNILKIENFIFEYADLFKDAIVKKIVVLAKRYERTDVFNKAMKMLIMENDDELFSRFFANTNAFRGCDSILENCVDIYNNPIRRFAIILDVPENKKDVEMALIASKNASLIYDFVLRMGNLNPLTDFEDAIIESGDLDYIFRFAKEIDGADISKLQDAILESGALDYIIEFARKIDGANIKKVEDAVINSGSASFICLLATLEGVDINRLLKSLVNVECRVSIIVEIVKNNNVKLDSETIEDLENIVIENGNMWDIIKFASYCDGANIVKLENIILDSNDPSYMCGFIRSVKGANKELLSQAIFNTGHIEMIADLLTTVDGDYKLLMEDFIMNSDLNDVCKLMNILFQLNNSFEVNMLYYYFVLFRKRVYLGDWSINSDGESFSFSGKNEAFVNDNRCLKMTRY